jgi:predicted RNA-binding Zn-ribbon protein involved in translation (DUF1610 family)
LGRYLRNNGQKPGTWKPLIDAGRVSATFACPKCGEIIFLTDHQIEEGGIITPLVICRTEGCGFHENIILEGWIFI